MHVQSCCFAVLARWRRRCCLSSPTYNETTPSWIDKNYACATGSSPLEDHYRTEKSDCSWFKTWYAELNSPPSRATTVNSPTDSFLYSMFCWHFVNECRDTRGNRGEIAPEQKSPTYYVNTAKTVGYRNQVLVSWPINGACALLRATLPATKVTHERTTGSCSQSHFSFRIINCLRAFRSVR